jgi:transposase-like protein
MIAYGTDDQGHKEILGCDVYATESKETWRSFFKNLKSRGLKGLLMITSDAHEGIIYAISKEFPRVPWQRCQFHFSRNIADKAPKKYQVGIRTELQEMFNCETIEDAREKRNAIIEDYQDVAEAAMACLDEGFEDAMTVMALPKRLRLYFRTSNHIERLNNELKRRSKVIGIFPNSESLLRLMGSVLIELSEAAQARKAIYTPETYKSMLDSETPVRLRVIASEQNQKLIA